MQRDGQDDPLTKGVVRATSSALAGRDHTATPTADIAASPTPHVQTGIAWEEGADQEIGNRIDLNLQNIGGATVDLAQASLTADGLAVVIETDGPTSVALTSPAGTLAGLAVTATPEGATGAVTDNRVTLVAPGAGRWQYSIDATAPSIPAPARNPNKPLASLPATGGRSALPAAAGLLLAALAGLGVRRRARGRY